MDEGTPEYSVSNGKLYGVFHYYHFSNSSFISHFLSIFFFILSNFTFSFVRDLVAMEHIFVLSKWVFSHFDLAFFILTHFRV
ncbi:hypothetical protein Syun_025302 [Stephania yunnanensis]|uniref:Uncharacterized protein n=1 Tax=Stephania yunnanensis TaxID=152371 RepID=A0AAP0EUD1_9MAGN